MAWLKPYLKTQSQKSDRWKASLLAHAAAYAPSLSWDPEFEGWPESTVFLKAPQS